MRRNGTLVLVALGLMLGLTAAGHAEHPHYDGASSNQVEIVIVPRLHPEVAVSRSLAEQPVHPWKIKVVLNGTMHTWMTPAEAHRLHPQHVEVTTSELRRYQNRLQERRSPSYRSGANRAQVSYPNRPRSGRRLRREPTDPNEASVSYPNRGRAHQPRQSRRRQQLHIAPPRPDQDYTAPAAEPAPRQQKDRRSVPIPSVPRHEEPPDARMAHRKSADR